ncbi:MAG TPA: GNAT family N-acetyltransferase [Acidimicrobiia bacterium]|nr:GNAT family N-acetyltransferase [Acidimicrobiia bacterium]
MTIETVEGIERVAAAAWPTNERTTVGEWVLSAGDGFSRRRNSTIPCGPVPADVEQRLDDVAGWYVVRGLPVLYRITPTCDPSIDRILDERGYRAESLTVVMTRPLGALEVVADVTSSPVATESWVSTELEALGVDRSLVGPWLATIAVVPAPVAFVTSMDGPQTAGAGFGMVDDGLLGVFEVAVRPDGRRWGHAKRIMSSLHAFGIRQDAEAVFLQVTEDNVAALDLYRSIGYEPLDRYWYRRAEA